MVTALCSPQDENPLSYGRLNGEWAQWFRTAQRFEHKVPAQDRGDIRHSIMLELALARARDGDKPFSEAMMCRIASCVVAHYWRKQYKLTNGLECGSCSQKQRQKCRSEDLYRQCPKAIQIESLSKPITDAEGNVTELGDTIADDKAIDVGAWLDARLNNIDAMYESTRDALWRPPQLLKKLVSAGFLGKKPGSKGGYYTYFIDS